VEAFLVVADGMGANRRGDTASRLTAEIVPKRFLEELRGSAGDSPSRDQIASALRAAMGAANEAVWRAGQDDAELKGMGTTCLAAALADGAAILCHAGDSRAYSLSGSELVQLTADHSLIQELVPTADASVDLEDRFGSVVTRGIGLSKLLESDLVVARLGPQDALLLCTDGLSNLVSDRRIAALLASSADAAAACSALVAAANEAGGADNIGVAVCLGDGFAPRELDADVASASSGGTVRGASRRRRRRRGDGAVATIIGLAALSVVLGALLYAADARARRAEARVRVLEASPRQVQESPGAAKAPGRK
jgi:protein phosphatase